jgi:dCTP deaminase
MLIDTEILTLIDKGIVKNTDRSFINPASLDVRIGKEIMVEGVEEKWTRLNIENRGHYLAPSEFILGCTMEVLDLPSDLCAEFYLKSSRAREGYDHNCACWIDPGFTGAITLEIKNNLRLRHIPLFHGMPIGQLVFRRLSTLPEKDYRQTGRYNNFATVKESLG